MDYPAELKVAIRQNYGCESRFERIAPVKDVFRGKIAWEGEVIVFDHLGHPKAKRCYAWGHPPEDDAPSREITTVLDISPVISAETAVRAAIAASTNAK